MRKTKGIDSFSWPAVGNALRAAAAASACESTPKKQNTNLDRREVAVPVRVEHALPELAHVVPGHAGGGGS